MKKFFYFWSIVSLLTIVNLLVFDLLIFFSPENIQVQFAPDDMYYYLQLAKNFAKFGQWTFDSGVSITTGFHPLLAYLLALLYRVFQPALESFVLYNVGLSATLTVFVGVYLWQKSLSFKNGYFFLFSALFMSTQGFLFNSVSGVEWSLVITLAVVYCFTFYQSAEEPGTSIILFVVGGLLSLARSDSGLLPLAVFLASVATVDSSIRKNNTMVRSSLAGLLGASVGSDLFFS
ncbi:MAG: hypothetical protein IPL71_00575 [Anaerolineales bacterium]|uniref:hypothetical protein n=1 Tax=Candidatus Villigracilis proximus TaxID=3140683 RepID=UPI0031369F76|nr:hypothetical protein [Anaerolineales bacterium]